MTTLRIAAPVLLLATAAVASADDWPQWLGPKRDGIWRETGVLDKFPEGGPKVIWRKEIGAGYCGPAVAGGKVFVMDRQVPKAKDGEKQPEQKADSFARAPLAGSERVLCLDAATGEQIWKHEYDCPYFRIAFPTGPRTTPAVNGKNVYTLGAMGHLLCLGADKGNVLWEKNFIKDYAAAPPVWGWSAHLLVDGNKLISLVAGRDMLKKEADKEKEPETNKNRAVIAFDKTTGKELWSALTTQEVGYAPPVIVEAGGKRQLIVWLSEAVYSLNPETGEVYWSHKHPADGKPQRPAVTIGTPVVQGDILYVSTVYNGGIGLKLAKDKPDATIAWRSKSDNPARPDGIHNLMVAPIARGGHFYAPGIKGELKCIEAATGKEVWTEQVLFGEKDALHGTVFWVENGDKTYALTDQGDLLIAEITPKGYEEMGRANVIKPSQFARGRDVVWAHPAFANRRVYARNDKEIVCVSLEK
jgi:outer membrane protein assembly factor BamB